MIAVSPHARKRQLQSCVGVDGEKPREVRIKTVPAESDKVNCH